MTDVRTQGLYREVLTGTAVEPPIATQGIYREVLHSATTTTRLRSFGLFREILHGPDAAAPATRRQSMIGSY